MRVERDEQMLDQVVEERRRTGQVCCLNRLVGRCYYCPFRCFNGGKLDPHANRQTVEINLDRSPQLRLHGTVSRGWGPRQGQKLGRSKYSRRQCVCEAFTFESP